MLEAVAQQEQTSYYVADIKPCSEFKLLRLRSASDRTTLYFSNFLFATPIVSLQCCWMFTGTG